MTALARKTRPRAQRDGAAAAALCLGARPDRRDAGRRAHQIRHRPLPAVHQARKPEPRRLDQGPHRAVDDRRRRALRAAGAGRHHRRGDRRQYRARPCAGRHPQGLPHRAGRARQDVAREDPASAGARRRGPHDPLRRRQGPSRILPGHGREDRRRDARRLLRQPVRQSGQPAGARDHDRPRDLEAARRGRRRRRRRRRLGRHADRARPLLRESLAEDRDGAGRSGRLGAGAADQDRQDGRGRQLDGRGHRRGFRAAQRRPVAGQEGLFDLRQAEHAGGPRPAFQGRHPGRLVVRHAACRGAALLPRADRCRSASSPSSATAATNICRRCSTISGWPSRALPSASSMAICATSSRARTARAARVSVGPEDSLLTAYGRMRRARRLATAGARRRQAGRHRRRRRHPGEGRRPL